jgi:ElaB/YqjD/DUF883 family membrane-anchored ribosome-binding protein
MAEKNEMDQAMDQAPAVSSQVEEKAERSVRHVRKAAADAGSAAGAVADEYQDRAEKVWHDARRRLHSFQDDSEQYIRENPTKAVFTALGVGFLLGMIFRR